VVKTKKYSLSKKCNFGEGSFKFFMKEELNVQEEMLMLPKMFEPKVLF
jgi:hypothetical protein